MYLLGNIGLWFALILVFVWKDAGGNSKPQIELSSRFFADDDVLASPRVTILSGQEATISVGKEGFIGQKTKKEKVFTGVMLSVTPTISDGRILLEGFAFVGEGQLEGEDGIKSQAKNALANLKKLQSKSDKDVKLPAFAEQVEMRGMFRLKGKPPRISLKYRDGASFWIELGQTRNGVKLVRVDLSDAAPHAILKKDGLFARIDLKTEKVSDIPSLMPMDGGGSVFSREVVPGENVNFPLTKPNGGNILLELTLKVVES